MGHQTTWKEVGSGTCCPGREEIHLPPSTLKVMGIELRSSGLTAGTFTHRPILPALHCLLGFQILLPPSPKSWGHRYIPPCGDFPLQLLAGTGSRHVTQAGLKPTRAVLPSPPKCRALQPRTATLYFLCQNMGSPRIPLAPQCISRT